MSATTPSSPWYSKAVWCVGIGLLANAAALIYSNSGGFPKFIESPAMGQNAPNAMLGARGIYMSPAQLGPNAYGVFIMDVDSSTIAVYRTLPDTSRMKLMAARSFKNDRFLEDFNNDSPTPKDVQSMVQKQRARVEEETKTKGATVEQPATLPTQPAPPSPAPPTSGPMLVPDAGG